MTKTCIKCQQELEINKENFKKHSVNGNYRNVCRSCLMARSKLWKKDRVKLNKNNRVHYGRHREAEIARSRARNVANPDKLWQYTIKRTYGLTAESYHQMLSNQNNLCAACAQPETALVKKTNKVRRLSVDHDHKTGLIRGLLCARCNFALGHLGDDPLRISALLEYIKKHKAI